MDCPSWSNWAGNLHYTGRVVQPRSISDVQDCVRRAARVVVVGSGHSFIHPTGPPAPLVSEKCSTQEGLVILDLTKTMNRVLSIEETSWTCTVEGGCTFETIARQLEQHGLALENMPSLHVVTFVGAALTGTHGCGVHRPVVADMIVSMRVVCGDGELREVTDRRLFVHLGLLGVVVQVTLRCVPFYRVRQRCYEGVPLTQFLDHASALVRSATHTQFWVDFKGGENGDGKVLGWLRDRCGATEPEVPTSIYPGVAGALRYEPVPVGEAPENPIHATGTGPWYDMLAFFRLGVELPVRDSVQVEFFVQLSQLPEALGALSTIPDVESLMSHGCEIRPILGDTFALSPCHRRFNESNEGDPLFVGIHFTLDHDPAKDNISTTVDEIEAALRPFNARPHWGKLFNNTADRLEALYGNSQHIDCAHFWATMLKWDPQAKLRNAVFDTIASQGPSVAKM